MRPLYIILLILWFIASWFLCNKYFTCTPQEDAVSQVAAEATGAAATATSGEGCVTELKFEDEEAEFMVSTSENFRFSINEEAQNEPSQALLDVISKVGDHLASNDDRFMRITGYFLDGEENSSEHENLGIARAKSVREYLKELGIDGAQLTTYGEMTESTCVEDGVLLKGVSVRFAEK